MYTFNVLRNVFDDDFFMANRRDYSPGGRAKTTRTDTGITYELEVPGCSEEDVSVEVGNNLLVIEATVRGKTISRTYTLPEGSDPQSVTATVEHGLLVVEIPNGERRKIL